MRISLTILLLISTTAIFAQGKLTHDEVNNKSYKYYLQSKWDSLANYVDMARKQDHDFYYLNVRGGIAHYKEQNYLKAIRYLKKAVAQNDGEELPKEYLYFAYLYADMEFEALEIGKTLKEATRERIKLKKSKPLDFIYAEGGPRISNRSDSIGNMYFAGLGLNHRFGYRFMLYHSYSFITQEAYWGDYKQHNYYIAPKIYANKGWTIEPSFQYMRTTGALASNSRERIILDTFIIQGVPPPPELQPPPPMGVMFDRYDTVTISQTLTDEGTNEQTGFMAYIGFTKNWGRVKLHPYFSYSTYSNEQTLQLTNDESRVLTSTYIDPGGRVFSGFITDFGDTVLTMTVNPTQDTSLIQAGLDISYTPPIKGDRLFFGATVSLHSFDGDINVLLAPYLGIKIAPWWYTTLSYYNGNAIYFVEQKGSVVNNTIDKIRQRAGMLNNFIVNDKLSLFLMYQYEQRNETVNEFDYNLHTLLTGIKIRL